MLKRLSAFAVLPLVFIAFTLICDFRTHFNFYRQCRTLQLGEELPYDHGVENTESFELMKQIKSNIVESTGPRVGPVTHPHAIACMNAKFSVETQAPVGIFERANRASSARKVPQSSTYPSHACTPQALFRSSNTCRLDLSKTSIRLPRSLLAFSKKK